MPGTASVPAPLALLKAVTVIAPEMSLPNEDVFGDTLWVGSGVLFASIPMSLLYLNRRTDSVDNGSMSYGRSPSKR